MGDKYDLSALYTCAKMKLTPPLFINMLCLFLKVENQ